MLKCPECHGPNIEPKGDNYYCHDCKKEIGKAMADQPKVDKDGKATNW